LATLWHKDLSLQNIMVSDGDDPQILSLLDWQNTCIGPLYVQFCEPTSLQLDFLLPDENPSQLYKPPLIDEDIPFAEESARLRRRYLESLNNAFPLDDSL
jgi:Phosphotransferase enzyme family